jgi:peptide/nickel transport system ATP-binding protein
VVESAPARALFGRPTHPYTRGLLSCVPVPGKIRPGHRLGSIPGVVPRITASFQGCGFRERCPQAAEACMRAIAPASAGTEHGYLCRLPPGWVAAPGASA